MSKLVRYETRGLTRLDRFREAVRSYWQGPRYTQDPALKEFFNTTPSSVTGITVSETSALSYSPVWAAVNCIAGDVSTLPLELMKRTGKGRERFTSHPLYRLLHDSPNPEMTSVMWRKTMQAHALTWGNGYSWIQLDGGGRVSALWPLTPDRVTPLRDGNRLLYRVAQHGEPDIFLDKSEMVHIKGLGFDGDVGYSPIAQARESLGLLAASERFGASFFGNGATIGGVISWPGPRPSELSDKDYLAALNSRHQGVDRAHRLLALYNGAKFEKMTVPPNDAQFLETRHFQVDEVARWFNIPPHKIGHLDRATYNNIEQQSQDYFNHTLMQWLESWEQELLLELVPPSEWNIQYIEHEVKGLLRGDTAARGAFYNQRFQTASITPNGIRELENENPIDGGDRGFVNTGMLPLDYAVDRYWEATIEALQAKAKADSQPPPQPTVDPNAEKVAQQARDLERLTDELALSRRKSQALEDEKDQIDADRVTLRAQLVASEAATETLRGTAAATEASLREQLTAAGEQFRIVDGQRVELDGHLGTTRAELAKAEELSNVLELTLEASRSQHEKAVEQCQRLDADYQRVSGEKEALGILIEEERTTRETAERALGDQILLLTAERDDARSHVESGTVEIARLVSATEGLSMDVSEARREQAEAEKLATAVLAEVRAQVVDLKQSLSEQTPQLLEARESLARESLRVTHLENSRATVQTLAESMESQIATLRVRQAEITQAVRASVLDRVTGMLEYESDRARRMQQSPEKLRTWLTSFYPGYTDRLREALKPAVRAWAVCVQHPEPLEHFLDIIVRDHVDQSVRQLRSVADESDPETLAQTLEKTLRRWETDRAQALLDRLLKESA